MKKVLAVVAAFAVAFVAAPAFAADGHVSSSTLQALGLGNMQVATDAEGMEVRGMASFAVTGGVSAAAGLAFVPGAATGSAALNFAAGGAAHGGILASNAAQANGSFANGAVTSTIPLVGTFSAAYASQSGGFGVASAQ